jgi:hypothetical protein
MQGAYIHTCLTMPNSALSIADRGCLSPQVCLSMADSSLPSFETVVILYFLKEKVRRSCWLGGEDREG